MNPDGEDWRRGYDDWKSTDPGPTKRDVQNIPPCDVCGASRERPRRLHEAYVAPGTCPNGHTPKQMDEAARAKRGW